jgi:hypothetical protein
MLLIWRKMYWLTIAHEYDPQTARGAGLQGSNPKQQTKSFLGRVLAISWPEP